MPFGFSRRQTLDPEQCFNLWIELGSVYKVPILLKEKYEIFNPRTGKPYTPMGVWNSAWNYVLNNLIEAKKKQEEVYRQNGEILQDRDWYSHVAKEAKYLYSPKRYQEFLNKHSYLIPYAEK